MAEKRKKTWILWVLLLGVLVFSQWPQIRLMGYRVLGIKAPKDNIPWRTDYAAALKEAEQTNKLLLLDFTADWCPPCQVMKHDVWPRESVRAAVEAGYIPVYLDVDAPSSADAAMRYGVRQIPTILITDASGTVLKEGGPMSASQMVDFLQSQSRPQ